MEPANRNIKTLLPVPHAVGWVFVIISFLFVTIIPSSTEAKSRTCVRLERQLASLSSTRKSRNPLKLLRYNSAIKRQKNQIKQAKRQIRRGGCATNQATRSRSCKKLNRSLSQMNANLKKLRVQRDKYSSKKRPSSRERRRIKRALKSNRCDELRPVIASNRRGVLVERSAGRRTIIEQIFGDERRAWERRNGYREYYDDQDYPGSQNPRRGTYRTLCVRTCDGYYFPVSFSTTPRNFDRDVDACRAKCPGTETELYYHSTNGEDSEDMVSYTDQQPYRELATAFNYRTAVTPGCGCNFKQVNYEAVAGDGNDDTNNPEDIEEFIATPTFKVDAGEDPDTLANRRGNFVPTPVKSASAKIASSGKRKVRVVGEAFFPGQ